MNIVPTIDLEKAEADACLLEPLDKACRDHGFFLLKNHGIQSAIGDMWAASEWFFNQPKDWKRQILRTEDVPLGYYDRELTKRQRDLKEVFDYMQPRADGSDVNQWPEDARAFRQSMELFFNAASDVAARTLNLVYRALADASVDGLPPGSARTSTVRLNCYPLADPLDSNEQTTVAGLGDMALHHHTDPGVLTLLLQDMTGGLQAKSASQGWIDVPPEEDTIVVNLGDVMQVWSNDNYVAAVHRVVTMTEVTRYSTPYFYNPLNDAVLEPLSQLSSQPAQYQSFTWREYIKGRVDDNYADLGEDDIQIDRFRVQSA